MSPRRPHRLAPRPVELALDHLQQRLAPVTLLARSQAAWPSAVGDAIAREAQPTGEREGVLSVTCSSAVWAQELDLMGPALVERLNASLEGRPIKGLRCRAG